MRTVVNVDGNPVVFNADRTVVIVQVNTAGSDQASATEIPRCSGHTVALATCTANASGVRLPSGAFIGDVVEVHQDSNSFSFPRAYPPIGETFFVGGPYLNIIGMIARKISDTVWTVMGN